MGENYCAGMKQMARLKGQRGECITLLYGVFHNIEKRIFVSDYAEWRFRATTHLVWVEGFVKSGFGAGWEYKHGW